VAITHRETAQIEAEDKLTVTAMWGFLVLLGIPGLVLTSLHDPQKLPLALTIVSGGTVLATATTLHVRHRSRRRTRQKR
jgi:hypothetical protein